MSRELELKYAVDDPDGARSLLAAVSLGGLATGPWRTVDVRDQYFDTPSRALARAGYGARLRHTAGATVLTVKGLTAEAGGGAKAGRRRRVDAAALHDRLELEGPAGRQLDSSRWPASEARALVEATAAGERLVTLFVLDQRREERELVRDGAVVATLSLDSATVRHARREVGSFTTLEIESTEPAAAEARRTLGQLAAVLAASEALQPEPRSKEQAALDMIERSGAAWLVPRPPRQPGVAVDDTLSEAARKVLRMQLLRMLATEPGVRASDAVEPVHKMRVATRRMRAAWRVFSGAFRPRLERRYVDALRVVARALGAVRDIDVQVGRLAAYRAGLDPAIAKDLTPLADEWQHRRAAAGQKLRRLLASAQYERFVIDYRSFVESPGAGSVAAPARLRDVAAGRIWRAYERVRTHDTTLATADAPALHALRIDGKRLRYTLEFLREVLPPSSERLIAEVTALQDHLGLLNDAQVCAGLTRAWLSDRAGRLGDAERAAAESYATTNEHEVARLMRSFGPTWRRLVSRSFRRRLAETLAEV